MNRRLTSVHVNEIQGNPFQPDVNYRGYSASPLFGTPQGLSVYMDGVRLNQPFGQVVSWDLIPASISMSLTLMPGSNPIFGLNTLGGALSLGTKSGLSSRGTSGRGCTAAMRDGLSSSNTADPEGRALHWFVAGNWFAEDGWRDDSPSEFVRCSARSGGASRSR